MPEFLTDDGIQLHYMEEGKGEPLVFVHGWMMSGRLFQRQVAAFCRSHRVIVPDLRGCGGSGSHPGTLNVPRFAEDLHELLDHLNLFGATLVGWSMGGGIVMHYAQTHGFRRMRSVGLVDFPPRLEEDPSVADKICHSLAKRRDSFVRDFVGRMFLRPPPPEELAEWTTETARCAADSACEMYRAMRPANLTAGVGPFPIPAFLAFPAQGWFRSALAEWKSLFPRHVAPEFNASKHAPFWEEPALFNEALASFLESSLRP